MQLQKLVLCSLMLFNSFLEMSCFET